MSDSKVRSCAFHRFIRFIRFIRCIGASATVLVMCLCREALPQQDKSVLDTAATGGRTAEVRLGIRVGGARRHPIALTGFDPEMASIITGDLYRAGSFQVVEAAVPDTGVSSGKGEFDRWKMAGARSLVRGATASEPPDLRVTSTLFDLSTASLVFMKDYGTGAERDKRSMSHRIADDIIYALTGERGISTTRIAYVARSASGHKEIFSADSDGNNPRQLTNFGSMLLSPAWSPDGREIAYTLYRGGDWHLHALDVGSGASRPLSTRPGLNVAASWSPDGTRIAFSMTADGNSEIYVINADGSGMRRLTDDPGIDTSPCWSPDGLNMVFTSDRSGTPRIYVMKADGTEQRGLIWGSEAYEDSPAWSPKGNRIAYVVRESEGFNIYTVDTGGEVPVRLTADSGSNEDPTWSPDGLRIAFASTRDGASRIYSMNWDGSEQQPLTSGGVCLSPSWSPRF